VPESKTRRQKVEEKERAIVAATRQVFREGVKDVKIATIARMARLAEGTVYLYFKNKQALLTAAVSDFYDELTRDARSVVRPQDDTVTTLRLLAELHFHRVLDEWPLITEAMSQYLPSPTYRETEAFALNRRYVAVFDSVIRDGVARGDLRGDVSVSAIRNMFYGGLEHCARTARLRHVAAGRSGEIDDFMNIFLGGIMDRLPPQAGQIDGAVVVNRLQRLLGEIQNQMGAADSDGLPSDGLPKA
jgi:AcrR family transcriptional regulator